MSLIPIVIIGGIQGFGSEAFLLIGIIAVVALSISIILSYLLSKSIEKLTNKIDEISKGKLDVNLEDSEIYEINKLTDSLNRVMASLKLAIHKVGVKKGDIFEETVRAKEEVEEKYCDLLDNISGWVWETDTKGYFTFVSKNIELLLGYKPKEIIGKNLFDILVTKDAKKYRNIFDEAVKKKKPIKNLESWNKGKKGEKCVITNAVPLFDEEGNIEGYRGVAIDITYRRNAEEKINELNKNYYELKNKYDNLLKDRKKLVTKKLVSDGNNFEEKWSEQDFDSICLFDEDAKIVDCNDNMTKNLGYSKSEILSFKMTDFDALESQDDFVNKIKDAKKHGSITFKTIHRRKDGSSVLVNENVQFLKDKKLYKCIAREDYSFKK